MSLVTIQGINIILSSLEDNGSYYAPQWFLESDLESDANVKDGAFEALASFKNPMAALKEIGSIILEETKNANKPVYFVGSTDKRTRIYAKLLKKYGINCIMEVEPDETKLAIKLI